MTNKKETINGRIKLGLDNVWELHSAYGRFPFARNTKRPDPVSADAWVEAVIQHGAVIDYHFANEKLDL